MIKRKLAVFSSLSGCHLFRCRAVPGFRVAIVLMLAIAAEPALAQGLSEVRLSDRTTVEFASLEKGRQLIGEVDLFLSKTSAVERQMRLKTNDPVSLEKLIESMQQGVRTWKQDEIASLTKIINELAADLSAYDLPLPERIHLIRVSSSVEANMPHCRGASIVLTDRFFGPNSPQKRILAHELFHVFSSHNPELRDKLYEIIGFMPCNEIELPESLAARRVTNPDAPVNKHIIELQRNEDETFFAVPAVTLRTDRYTSGTFIQNIDFGLMVVEKNDQDQWVAKVEDGKPELLEPSQVPDFARKIGRNTRYVIHPEETLADNFAMLVLGIDDVPDPWVMEKMQEVLMAN